MIKLAKYAVMAAAALYFVLLAAEYSADQFGDDGFIGEYKHDAAGTEALLYFPSANGYAHFYETQKAMEEHE